MAFICFLVVRELCKPGRWLETTRMAHAMRYVTNMNDIEIDIGKNLDAKKVRVIWELDGPPEKSPLAIKTLFDGSRADPPEYVYGWNHFSVWYGETLVKRYSQFKANAWHSHIYYFRLKSEKGAPVVQLKIVGPDDPHTTPWSEPLVQ